MRFLDVIGTAIGNSFRSRLRTTLTVIAIFIGAFTLTITTAIGTGVSDYINTQIATLGSPGVLSITKTAEDTANTGDGPAEFDPDAVTGGGFAGAPGGLAPGLLTEYDITAIQDTDGILDASAIVMVTPAFIEHDGSGKFELTVNPGAAFALADLASGEQLSADTDEHQILLPASYLDALDLGDAQDALGQTVTIGIRDYLGEMHEVDAVVTGIQNESIFAAGAALGQQLTDALLEVQNQGRPPSLAEGFFGATAQIDPDATDEQITEIKTALSDQGFTAQTTADQIGTVQTIIDGIIGVLNAFAVIALIAAGFGIINTLLMSVQERTREIGLMKAMGMSGGRVFALFSTEAVFIGFLGSAIGAAAAIGLGTLISNVLADTVLADLQGLQVLQFAPASVASIILVVMLIAFLAGTLPARRASAQDPIDALRYE